MLEPKEYQNRALYWLKRYFQNCRRLGKAGTAFYETTSQIHEGDGIGYRNVKEGTLLGETTHQLEHKLRLFHLLLPVIASN
jgi:hypothetical protein